MDRLIDKVSSQFEPAMTRIDKKVLSLNSIVTKMLQDIQGVKSRQDMLFIKHDRIQSTLSGTVPTLCSPSTERAVVAWSPSPQPMFIPTRNHLFVQHYQSPAIYSTPIVHTPSTSNPPPVSEVLAQMKNVAAETRQSNAFPEVSNIDIEF